MTISLTQSEFFIFLHFNEDEQTQFFEIHKIVYRNKPKEKKITKSHLIVFSEIVTQVSVGVYAE